MELISAFVQSTLFDKLLGPIAVIALLSFFWWRAGTVHSLFDRLWRLTAGSGDVHDSELKEFINTNRDLEKFRFLYGLKVDTLENLHRLLKWLSANKVGISSVQLAKRWIDLRLPDIITRPTKGQAIGAWLGLIFWTLLSAGAIPLTAYPSALLQTKATQVWFLVDNGSIRHPLTGWEVQLTHCDAEKPDKIQEITGFSKSEVDSICKGYQDGTLKEFAKNSLKQQQWVGGLLAGACTVMLIAAFFGVISVREAMSIWKKVANHVVDPNPEPDSKEIQPKKRTPKRPSKSPMHSDAGSTTLVNPSESKETSA